MDKRLSDAEMSKQIESLKDDHETTIGKGISTALSDLLETVPIVGKYISVSKNVRDSMASHNYSKRLVRVLTSLNEEDKDLSNRLKNLNQQQRDVLGLSLYADCVAYDNSLSERKKDYIYNLIHNNLKNPKKLNLTSQDLYLAVIQSVPEYSLIFLKDMDSKFKLKEQAEFNKSTENEYQPWAKFKKQWEQKSKKILGVKVDASLALEPLVSRGLVRRLFQGVLGGTRIIYNVTETGENFLNFIDISEKDEG